MSKFFLFTLTMFFYGLNTSIVCNLYGAIQPADGSNKPVKNKSLLTYGCESKKTKATPNQKKSNESSLFDDCKKTNVRKTLSIEEAVKEALLKKPSVHAQQQSVKNYERLRKETLSTFLPNVTLSETFYNNNNVSNIKSSFGIQASQTVLDLARVNYYRMAHAQFEGAKHEKAKHKDEIRLAVESSFLSSWLLQQKLNLILLLFNASKETFAKSKNQFDLKLLDKNDFLKDKTTHATNLETVNNYQNDIDEAEKLLEYYIQTPIALLLPRTTISEKSYCPTGLVWNPHEEIILKTFRFYYDHALRNRKDLKSKQSVIDLKSHTSQYYTKQYLPNVSAFANRTKNTLREGNSTLSKEAGILISWNVFDGLSNYFKKSAADAEKMKAILEKHDLVKQIKYEVQQAHTALQKALDKLAKEKISFNQASNEFDLRKQEFGTGLISKVDYQTARYNYENSRITWLSQAVTTAIKERELLKACGYPTSA